MGFFRITAAAALILGAGLVHGAWSGRWGYASEPGLSKLSVVREFSGAAVEPDRDPCKDFLDVLLPEVDRAVFVQAG